MIEIAISLAVIGFALVAIIGILPRGLEAQRDNREETIINYDGNVFMNALCNGQQGLDDLINSVVAITNYQTLCNSNGVPVPGGAAVYGYTYTNSTMNPPFPITNGFRIVGLLSTPKYVPIPTGARAGSFYYSNHVVAVVRSLSGAASDKFPQQNPTIQDFAFTYRLIPEVVPYGFGPPTTEPGQGIENNAWSHEWTNYTQHADWQWRSNYWVYAKNVQADLYDVRLLFRWPAVRGVVPFNGRRLVFRSATSGPLQAVVEPEFQTQPNLLPYTLYFAQPRTFVKAP